MRLIHFQLINRMIKLAWERADGAFQYSTMMHQWKVRQSTGILAKVNGQILSTQFEKVLAYHCRVTPADEVPLDVINDAFLPEDKRFIHDF